MKKILLFLVFALTSQILAQDTNIVKYLPLKVGNNWVYSWGNGRQRLTINGTVSAHGHIYYSSIVYGAACAPCPNAYGPFGILMNPIRVDSVTGNIMVLGNSCIYNGEYRLDSLKARLGDVSNSCNTSYCYDTNTVNIFGVNRNTKYLGLNIPNWWIQRRYAKDFGLIYATKGCWVAGSCSYTITGAIINNVLYGDTSLTAIFPISSEIPNSFSLSQNYPNPFNPKTIIRFQVASDRFVSLKVFDALGKEVTTIVNEQLKPGTYEADWDATNYPSGVYFYKIEAGNFIQTNKMVLLK